MRKFLLLFVAVAVAALSLGSCDKAEESNALTFTISPSTAKLGDEVTLKVSGDGVENYRWSACYEFEEGGGSCLFFEDGATTKVVTLDRARFAAGNYDFYAAYYEGEDDNQGTKINHAKLVVKE